MKKKSNTNRLKLGDANSICDVSGQKFKYSEMVTDWKGNRVYWRYADPRPLHEDPIIIPPGESTPLIDGRPRVPDVVRQNLLTWNLMTSRWEDYTETWDTYK